MQEIEEVALSDSLELLGERVHDDSNVVTYGDLELSIAPKEGKANTLLADQLFSPALLLAERIERGLIPLAGKTMIELGAGCALPSLLASTLPGAPALAVVTDYPSDVILSNLQRNVQRNAHLRQPGGRVVALGYEWGADTSPVLHLLPGDSQGFDVVILSDLLHFDSSHAELAHSLVKLLGRHGDARVYAAAGKYTAWKVCEAFLAESAAWGIVWTSECSVEDPERERWLGELKVKGLSSDDLGRRKGNCWWWVGRWRLPTEGRSGQGDHEDEQVEGRGIPGSLSV